MNKATTEQVRCPGCGGKQPKRTADAIYYCSRCQCQFDDDPGEGGDHSEFNAGWRMERAERRKGRRL